MTDCNECYLSMLNCHDMSICCEDEEYEGEECLWFEPIAQEDKTEMKHHKLKLDMNFCDDVLSGRKNFEVRYNDRGYQAGDIVSFIPYVGMLRSHHEIEDKKYQITYVLDGWGLKNNYVVFGIKPYREDGDTSETDD